MVVEGLVGVVVVDLWVVAVTVGMDSRSMHT